MPENIQEEVEDKLIDWIALGSDGRLVAFKPEKEADLAVQKKGDYPGKKIFFNINVIAGPAQEKNFEESAKILKKSEQKNLYFLFVVFDEVRQKIEDKLWIVPGGLINKEKFLSFLVDKLISENSPKSRVGFKQKQY
jgi:hypothetical protein